MPAKQASEPHQHVPLTRFHNNTGEFLDLSTRTPVILTSHGRERHVIAEIGYFRHLEAAAAGKLLEGMDLQAVRAENMSDEDYDALEASRPTPEEIASDQWND